MPKAAERVRPDVDAASTYRRAAVVAHGNPECDFRRGPPSLARNPRAGAYPVQALERIDRVQLGAVGGGEGHVGQHVGLALVHEGGELGQRRSELVGVRPRMQYVHVSGDPLRRSRMWAPAATVATSTRCSSEVEAFWTAFLRKLTQRGLRGVKLVVSDAHEHFARNALAYVGRNGRRVVAAFIATAFAQNDEEAAKGQWRNSLAVSRCSRVTVSKTPGLRTRTVAYCAAAWHMGREAPGGLGD